jgi:hypothetical protein
MKVETASRSAIPQIFQLSAFRFPLSPALPMRVTRSSLEGAA